MKVTKILIAVALILSLASTVFADGNLWRRTLNFSIYHEWILDEVEKVKFEAIDWEGYLTLASEYSGIKATIPGNYPIRVAIFESSEDMYNTCAAYKIDLGPNPISVALYIPEYNIIFLPKSCAVGSVIAHELVHALFDYSGIEASRDKQEALAEKVEIRVFRYEHNLED